MHNSCCMLACLYHLLFGHEYLLWASVGGVNDSTSQWSRLNMAVFCHWRRSWDVVTQFLKQISLKKDPRVVQFDRPELLDILTNRCKTCSCTTGPDSDQIKLTRVPDVVTEWTHTALCSASSTAARLSLALVGISGWFGRRSSSS